MKQSIRTLLGRLAFDASNQPKKMKQALRTLLRKFGYDLVDFDPGEMGKYPVEDMAKFLDHDRPLILDVGANVGQSARKFRSRFPGSIIHSFEPHQACFKSLCQQVSGLQDVRPWNFAMGSVSGRMTFQENSNWDMSSFLPLSEFGWGKVVSETSVEVKTIDQFCREENIERIDILKSDTQGFDLEVFKGAERMFRARQIKMVYFEVIFSDMYKGLPSFSKTLDFLTDRDFLLVSLYRFSYQKRLAGWTNALFVHKSCAQTGG